MYVRLIRNKNNWKLASGGNKPVHPARPGIKESKRGPGNFVSSPVGDVTLSHTRICHGIELSDSTSVPAPGTRVSGYVCRTACTRSPQYNFVRRTSRPNWSNRNPANAGNLIASMYADTNVDADAAIDVSPRDPASFVIASIPNDPPRDDDPRATKFQ